MDIKEAGPAFTTALENELIQIRADQRELAQDLTERINGVGRRLKSLDAKVELRFSSVDAQLQLLGSRIKVMDAKFEGKFDTVNNRLDTVDSRLDAVESRLGGIQETQQQMLGVLVGIQRRLEAA
ncbi:hypothetical protein SMD20_15040 [Nonomuraea sp. LP-02]|uniref:hypothetical protein n=1 Tax=Nonomuraea sp. LP-02 TaxID=3097960 RepID=UPI002E2F2911|nr:hypothetical protein [Nonomuraea sp. LP-02]MED7925567.1 hypothetical protein [Nonomuraea sp. LP-02]